MWRRSRKRLFIYLLNLAVKHMVQLLGSKYADCEKLARQGRWSYTYISITTVVGFVCELFNLKRLKVYVII